MFKRSKSDYIIDGFIFLVMAIILVVTLYPFLNILAISFNDSVDTVKGGVGIIPRVFTLDNYKQVFRNDNLMSAFVVSVARTVIGVLVSLISSCMFAYTLSRKDFMCRKIFALLLLLTLYVSGGLVPDYMLIRQLGLMNSFWVYIIPGLIGGWNVIVIRSYMDGLPISVQESAQVDGANDFVIFYKIVLPLCLPVVATISLFIAVGQWNSWMDTYLYASSKEVLSTLQYELVKILLASQTAVDASQSLTSTSLYTVSSVSPTAVRMAITVVATLPILFVYPFVQKYFISGMTLGAVKG